VNENICVSYGFYGYGIVGVELSGSTALELINKFIG
jgi:hypothetical protein